MLYELTLKFTLNFCCHLLTLRLFQTHKNFFHFRNIRIFLIKPERLSIYQILMRQNVHKEKKTILETECFNTYLKTHTALYCMENRFIHLCFEDGSYGFGTT